MDRTTDPGAAGDRATTRAAVASFPSGSAGRAPAPVRPAGHRGAGEGS